MGKFTQFKLPLKAMPMGSQSFEYKLDKQFFTNMESADIHGADIDVHLDVDHRSDSYALHFNVAGTVTVLCDRCLDALELPIQASYDITVKYGDRYCDESDTVLEIPESENFLNVAYMLYDTVALQIPIKHVHPAGKCNRAMSSVLSRHSVKNANHPSDADADLEQTLIEEMDSMPDDEPQTDNDNTDPRWDALKELSSDADD